jgi:hypothetical protein
MPRYTHDCAPRTQPKDSEEHIVAYLFSTVPGAQHEVVRESGGPALLRSNGQA